MTSCSKWRNGKQLKVSIGSKLFCGSASLPENWTWYNIIIYTVHVYNASIWHQYLTFFLQYFALQILENLIKSKWKILPRDQCEGNTHIMYIFVYCVVFFYRKGHSCSPWPQKSVHNFSLECLTIFLPAPFSYNSFNHFCVCVCVCVKFQSIASLLSYSVIMY